MKLKELPGSLAQTLKLWSKHPQQLGQMAIKCKYPCIISLTSIPSRLNILHLTVRSLLDQDMKADKILLWLHHDLKNALPASLTKLESDRFQIMYCHATDSHRKLVETLKNHRDELIVTCDDDMMYPSNWLSHLIHEHELHPRAIIGNECRVIRYSDNTLLPYQKWPSAEPGSNLRGTLAIGYSGIVYPPRCLDENACDRDLFLKFCPRADDLWFKAMALLAGTETRRAKKPNKKPTPIAFSQKISLKKNNVKEDGNRQQWQAISDYFNISID